MVTLNFRLSPGWDRDLTAQNLAAADEMTLRYDLFLGDITFTVGTSDFSARWGWVPVLDFAMALQAIVEALATEDYELFEFTESDASIRFSREGENVRIEASYAPEHTQIPYVELRGAAEAFLVHVLEELVQLHPGIRHNSVLAPYIRSPGFPGV